MQSNRNAVNETYAKQIKASLRDDLFGEFGDFISDRQAALYVHDRPDRRAPLELELELFSLLKSPPGRRSSRIIPLIGDAGAGKTTLLKFLFGRLFPLSDWYLLGNYLNESTSPRLDGADAQSYLFSQGILAIYVDVSNVWRKDKIDSHVTIRIRDQLKRLVGSNIATEHDFAMWNRQVTFDNVEETARRRKAENDKYVEWMEDVSRPWRSDPFVYSRELLWYLNTNGKIANSLLIVDNADTMDVSLQVELWKMLYEWSGAVNSTPDESCLPFARTIVPLRPETWDILTNHNVIHKVDPVAISVPQEDDVIRLRADELERAVVSAGVDLNEDVEMGMHDGGKTPYSVFRVYPAPFVGTALREMTLVESDDRMEPYNASRSVEPGDSGVLQRGRRIYALLQNRSIRRSVLLRRQLVSNRGVQQAILSNGRGRPKKERAAQRAIGGYHVVDAIVCGPHRQYQKFRATGDSEVVANLYECDESDDATAHSIMVGPLMCQMLHVSKPRSEGSIREGFTRMGFPAGVVDSAIASLVRCRFMHRVGAEVDVIRIESAICEAHWLLLRHPAYVDNMCQVTTSFMEQGRIDYTVGYLDEDFEKRVEMALRFIRFLEECETTLLSYDSRLAEEGISKDVFKGEWNKWGFRSIHRRVALGYRERLWSMRQKGTYAGSSNANTFDRWLRRPEISPNGADAWANLDRKSFFQVLEHEESKKMITCD